MPGYQKLARPLRRYAVRGRRIRVRYDGGHRRSIVICQKRSGVRYPLAVASDDLKLKFGGIEGLPTTMIYDRQGVLRKKMIGFEYTDVIESELKPLL